MEQTRAGEGDHAAGGLGAAGAAETAARLGFGAGELGGWLTLPEAAERYGIGLDELRRAADEGRVAVRRVGNDSGAPWLVQPEQMEQLLNHLRAGDQPSSDAAERQRFAGAGGGSTRAAGSEGSAIGGPELRTTEIMAGVETQQAPPSPRITGTHEQVTGAAERNDTGTEMGGGAGAALREAGEDASDQP